MLHGLKTKTWPTILLLTINLLSATVKPAIAASPPDMSGNESAWEGPVGKLLPNGETKLWSWDPSWAEDSPYPINSRSFEKTFRWFMTPNLNRTEYTERNWMWIRCRAKYSTFFDIGGRWTEDDAKVFKKGMKKVPCFPNQYKVKYYQHPEEKWGDASVTFEWGQWLGSLGVCTLKKAVDLAVKAAQPILAADRRELYIWNCPGYETSGNSGLEWNPVDFNKVGPAFVGGYRGPKISIKYDPKTNT